MKWEKGRRRKNREQPLQYQGNSLREEEKEGGQNKKQRLVSNYHKCFPLQEE